MLVKTVKIMIALFVTAGLTSCYDGWDDYAGNANGTTDPSTDPTTIKSLYYVNFVAIFLNDAALADGGCGSPSGAANFRSAEYSERIAAASKSLSGVAEKFVYTPVTITLSDCSSLSAVDTAASAITSETTLADDPLDRPIVQLKTVFFNADLGGDFTSAVTTPQWATWRRLRAKGRAAVSLHYFDLSNSTAGHFSNWRTGLDSALVSNATVIDNIDPTDTGKQNRQLTAASDASTLATWTVTTALKERP